MTSFFKHLPSSYSKSLACVSAVWPNDRQAILPVLKWADRRCCTAFSAICTHLACITYWHERRQVIQCPCHDGRFNPLNGMVISGPPPRPLPPYELEIVEGQVYIGEVKGSIGPI